jgi:hypothetical protein
MNAAPLPSTPARRSIAEVLIAWANRVRYIAFSGLLHLILVVILGGTVLYKQYAEPPDFTGSAEGFITEDVPLPVPVETTGVENPDLAQSSDASAAAASTAAASATASQMATITTTAPATNNFTAALPAPNISLNPAQSSPSAVPASAISGTGLSKGQATRIASFTGRWSKGGPSMMGQPLKSRAFEFTAYLAKYAGGDWDSTVWLDGENVRGGSLHNLLYIISRLSHQKIHADPQPVPLDLASNEIFEKKPPFIWFTGHRDFVLTDQEVVNLGEYLRSGGCIWGDSSLPGNRSRFDIAFRREMLRILPELKHRWEPLPTSHPIYTNPYYSEIKGVAPGMNFYKEPVYGLRGFAGEIAIIYTANDYGDMWQFGLDENGDFDMSRDDKRRFVAINEQMWRRRNLYFRNVEPKPLMDTYKFGTNIIIHLLTRWEAHVRFAPTASKTP